MFNKILFIIWYTLRPKYYFHFFSLIKRKFLTNHDTKINRNKAFEWASSNAVPYNDAMKKLGLNGDKVGLDKDTILEG
jgi:hypothetical protein